MSMAFLYLFLYSLNFAYYSYNWWGETIKIRKSNAHHRGEKRPYLAIKPGIFRNNSNNKGNGTKLSGQLHHGGRTIIFSSILYFKKIF
jgi:hypothetical protein